MKQDDRPEPTPLVSAPVYAHRPWETQHGRPSFQTASLGFPASKKSVPNQTCAPHYDTRLQQYTSPQLHENAKISYVRRSSSVTTLLRNHMFRLTARITAGSAHNQERIR